MKPQTVRLGLTGGIGSGKSTVASLLAQAGAAIMDADAISRSLTQAGGMAIPAILAEFGEKLITPEGAMDRDAMRALVFSNPQAKRQLEAIVHPLVSLRSSQQAQAAEASGARVIVFDVPLLVESGRWAQRLDSIVVVDCPEHLQIQRVMARNGLERATVESILAAQAPRRIRRASADIVIDNGDNCSLADLQQLATETAALFGL